MQSLLLLVPLSETRAIWGVSAKSYAFDEDGNETNTDFYKMINIVLDADYHDYIGVEYEGNDLREEEGIIAIRKLLEKIRTDIG